MLRVELLQSRERGVQSLEAQILHGVQRRRLLAVLLTSWSPPDGPGLPVKDQTVCGFV